MSQYINFFVRHKDNAFYVPIGSYSRNSIIYTIFAEDVPYEELFSLSIADIDECIAEAKQTIDNYKSRIRTKERLIENILQSNNDLEEKIESINGIYEEIESIKEEIEYYSSTISFCNFLINIIYEDTEVYCGIEVADPNGK